MKSSAEKFLEREIDRLTKELDKLRTTNADLVMTMNLIASRASIGADSKSASNSTVSFFMSIEQMAREAIRRVDKS